MKKSCFTCKNTSSSSRKLDSAEDGEAPPATSPPSMPPAHAAGGAAPNHRQLKREKTNENKKISRVKERQRVEDVVPCGQQRVFGCLVLGSPLKLSAKKATKPNPLFVCSSGEILTFLITA